MVCTCVVFIQLEIMRKDGPGEPSARPILPLLVFFLLRPLQMAGKVQG